MNNLPDFLGIGAQKAGTSWLHENLRKHPDAFLPTLKELHYFDDRYDQPLEIYEKYFEQAGDKLKGEITPAYAILPPDRIRRIHELMPRLRLIFLMRNPIERAWSHALMSLITHTGRKYAQVSDAEFIAHFRGAPSLDRGDYLNVIDNWLGVFPKDQLFLGYFQEIEAQPIQLLKEVFGHIGLRSDVDFSQFPISQRVYPGPGIDMPDKYRAVLRELYLPRIAKLRQRLGSDVKTWK